MESDDGAIDELAARAETERLLRSVSDAVWMASGDGREVLYANDRFAEIYGRDSREFVEDPSLWLAVVHPDDRVVAEGSMRELAERGEAEAEYRVVRPDREVRWISDRKVRIRGGGAAGDMIGGFARDVTERKHAEQLAGVQQCILQAIATRDEPAEILVRICEEVERFVPGSTATILLLDDDRRLAVAAAPSCPPEVVAAIDGLVPGRNVGSCGTAAYTAEPCLVADAHTDERWSGLRDVAERFGIRACWSYPILSDGRSVLGTIALSGFEPRVPSPMHERLLEVASRLAAICVQSDRDRRDLTAAVAAARAAARSKSELLANVSHELRTPMTAILGFADMLLEDEGLPERHRDDLRLIRSSGGHLLELINDLLDLSKIEAGRMEPELLPIAPRTILDEVIALFEGTVRTKGLRFEVSGRDALPERIVTDPTRLRQILVNLLSNAVKFTERGSIEVRCGSAVLPDGSVRIEVAVSDTGVGISSEHLEQIFSPFGQADSSTTRRFGGTGLGLTLSRRLARLLGGDISVESTPGRGSRFALRVVAAVPRGTPETLRVPSAARTGSPRATQRRLACRVLVAEDARPLQRLVRSVLERAGADVVVVEDGTAACRAAVQSAASTPFDVVVMDMQMPVMDGYEAVRTLRAEGYSGPVIALTAGARPDDRDRCLASGCDEYLTKPIDCAKLLDLIADRIRGSGPASDAG